MCRPPGGHGRPRPRQNIRRRYRCAARGRASKKYYGSYNS